MDCSCAPIFRFFLCGVRWRHNSAKFSTEFFGQFRTSLRNDSVANNMHRFGRCFRNLLQEQMYFATH